MQVHSQRLETDSNIGDTLQVIFRAPKKSFTCKIKITFGFILRNVETEEKRYYYPLQNGFIFGQPLGVADEDDLQRVLQRMGEVDWLEYARKQKPNSKWLITLLTNVAFHLYPLFDRPIGQG